MSALGKFVGVECAACRRRGHRCQAQIVAPIEIVRHGAEVVSEEPLCLRCADGEPCCFETAALRETPRWLEEDVDPCEVPKLSAEDRAFIAAVGKPQPLPEVRIDAVGRTHLSEELREQVIAESSATSIAEAAQKFGIPEGTVRNLRHNEWRRIFRGNRRRAEKLAAGTAALRPKFFGNWRELRGDSGQA
jgi:hypothetical protein